MWEQILRGFCSRTHTENVTLFASCSYSPTNMIYVYIFVKAFLYIPVYSCIFLYIKMMEIGRTHAMFTVVVSCANLLLLLPLPPPFPPPPVSKAPAKSPLARCVACSCVLRALTSCSLDTRRGSFHCGTSAKDCQRGTSLPTYRTASR